ncbi:MAG: hypothetical protein WBE08_11705 [Methyloceanibacter sp.]|jgi:hypothetical protein
MPHLPMILGAALLTACLFAGPKANAAPVLSPNSVVNLATQAETVGYRYRRGYRPYRYWGPRYYRPYGYYRPYRYWSYGYRPYRRYGWRY